MKAFTSDYFSRESARRTRYFEVVHALTVCISLFYILKYNFMYEVTDYNRSLLAAWTALLIVPLVCRKIWGVESFKTRLILSAGCALMIIYMLYLVGGLEAPGLVWLCAIPIASAILLGVSWAVWSNLFVLAVFLTFYLFHVEGFGPHILRGHPNYSYLDEKFFNFILFLLFSGFTTIFIFWGEKKSVGKLKEKHGDIENLLRVLIHDVANTLSSMTLSLLLARQDRDEGSLLGTKNLERMEEAVDSISSLLGQIRTLKSVKDGKSGLTLENASLMALIKTGCDRAQPAASNKKIAIEFVKSADDLNVRVEKSIFVDVIFSNLMSNAIKFSPVGGRIEISLSADCHEAVLEVRDNGVGMPKNILQNLFRVDVATTRTGTGGEKGTGYGMPLVREYLQMMNGSVNVLSEEKASRTFPEAPWSPSHPSPSRALVTVLISRRGSRFRVDRGHRPPWEGIRAEGLRKKRTGFPVRSWSTSRWW